MASWEAGSTASGWASQIPSPPSSYATPTFQRIIRKMNLCILLQCYQLCSKIFAACFVSFLQHQVHVTEKDRAFETLLQVKRHLYVIAVYLFKYKKSLSDTHRHNCDRMMNVRSLFISPHVRCLWI